MMHRRDFLRALATASALARPARPRAARRESVIVIGAGFAGLAAANALRGAGQSVVVLEGRDRIGGRAWTSRAWPDTPLDMGASWIHGINGNPLRKLADAIGAPRIVTRSESAITYGTDGREIGSEFEKYIDDLDTRVKRAIAGTRRQGGDRSVERAVLDGIDTGAMTAGQRAALQYHLASAYEHEYGGDISELSARYFDADDDYGGDDVLLPNGFGELSSFLARGLDIRTGRRVARVSWTPRSVSVDTNRGTVDGDRAIVTLPLGVLQRGAVEFSPALPVRKARAIEALGMGTLNKLYLRFSRSFWPAKYDWLEYISSERGRWCEWIGGFERYVQRPVLLGFNAGRFGAEIEAWTDDRIVEGAMTTLRTIFGRGIPDPVGAQITRWNADPFACGSYSYYRVGSTPDSRKALAEPVGGRLFFAGEATSVDSPSTVHGAYESGQDAAEAVLAELR